MTDFFGDQTPFSDKNPLFGAIYTSSDHEVVDERIKPTELFDDLSPIQTFEVPPPDDEMILAPRAIVASITEADSLPRTRSKLGYLAEVVGILSLLPFSITASGALFQGERPTLEPIPAEIVPQIGESVTSPITTIIISD